MTTLIFTHPICIEHDPGAHHPESTDRLRAVLKALDAEEFKGLERREAPIADLEAIKRVHDSDYVDAVMENIPTSGIIHLDPDTALSPASGEAALRAAGAACAAVDAVMNGEAKNAFCAVRPPGHHAEHGRAMGFCIFNNVAVAAEQARAVHGLKRIAVVDFDVHHGNGTQHSFENDAELFFASSHQSPFYPGTGRETDRGVANNIVNVELPAGSGSQAFRDGWTNRILPELLTFRPDMIIISAGFDAHASDPLAQISLSDDDYAWITGKLLALAQKCCEGRLISSLEGGYDLAALASSTTAHVRALSA
ncbi:MAG: histone deacetylase family protein [Rhodospirillaceae bacterium]|jgi:acetoin utilization deacetylase AcuC-like enzyme